MKRRVRNPIHGVVRTLAGPLALLMIAPTWAQSGPSMATRERTLKSVVYITADQCTDRSQRAGSGFALEAPGRIITAHHVVGGCQKVLVHYEGASATEGKLRQAVVARVLAEGDLALLTVDKPPPVAALKLAPPPPRKDEGHAGFGYQNGQLSAGDVAVMFSSGSARLRDLLTPETLNELQRIASPIRTDRPVLRFNVALQPGMSGGPIINAQGDVVGIVAGGLKAGAAPASWGWPAEWVADLLGSKQDTTQPITLAGAYYSLTDLQSVAKARSSGRRLTCGMLEFVYLGRRLFADVARGADDYPRVLHLVNSSRLPADTVNAYQFDIWSHEASGATAVAPAGYALARQGDACVARSASRTFEHVIWAAPARNAPEVQSQSVAFEQRVMTPRIPYNFGLTIDPQLTTFQAPGVPGPQFRANGMVFTRKGFILPKQPAMFPGAVVPFAHAFETLVANAGTFLGVGTINHDQPPWLNQCVMTGAGDPRCASAFAHLHEWTHFVLATQLSTYPAF